MKGFEIPDSEQMIGFFSRQVGQHGREHGVHFLFGLAHASAYRKAIEIERCEKITAFFSEDRIHSAMDYGIERLLLWIGFMGDKRPLFPAVRSIQGFLEL